MKRTSNMRWAKFAAAAAVGLGMLAGVASPALAQEIQALTINPTGTLIAGSNGATITGTIVCDPTVVATLEFVQVNQITKHTQFVTAAAAPGTTITCNGTLQPWTATALVTFPTSGLLHKGRAGVVVQFGGGIDDPVLVASARVKLQ